MGIFDKLKAAASAVTGGAATVSIQYEPQLAFAGDTIRVIVTAASAGAEGLEPSYRGGYAQHQWQIRGRIEAFGNDPDSGWQPLRVGVKV